MQKFLNLKEKGIFAQEQSALKRGEETEKCFMNVESTNYALKKFQWRKR